MTALALTSGTLKDKTIWVTGASRGLGRAIVEGIVDRGGRVVASSRSQADLKSLAGEIGEDRVFACPVAVDDAPAVRRAVEQMVADHGQIHGLVNNAGVSPSFEPADKVSDETWEEVIRVNLFGTFVCARELGRHMLDQGTGSIVNISSVHARAGFQRIAPYAASKGGVEALTRTLAVEWAARGVRVNVLAPGYFATDLSEGLLESRWGDEIRGRTPMERVGKPEELLGAACFLLSDDASFITGSTTTVDGGWTAW